MLYGDFIPIRPGVAVIHRERSENSYDDLKILEQEIIRALKEVIDWNIFSNIFIYGGFDESEVLVLKNITSIFYPVITITIDVQVWDINMENKFIIEELK